jgi:hypothetical protein
MQSRRQRQMLRTGLFARFTSSAHLHDETPPFKMKRFTLGTSLRTDLASRVCPRLERDSTVRPGECPQTRSVHAALLRSPRLAATQPLRADGQFVAMTSMGKGLRPDSWRFGEFRAVSRLDRSIVGNWATRAVCATGLVDERRFDVDLWTQTCECADDPGVISVLSSHSR